MADVEAALATVHAVPAVQGGAELVGSLSRLIGVVGLAWDEDVRPRGCAVRSGSRP